ncbi:hypothetical protein C9374_008336 [Naegleria lovaniensis]|uniref:Uncharacterized protein n=1 Tax=Naegleria lovaniensis TaxID=51637 RepID=A0AA88KHU4_NAELO|nr:uncharacterized protein C9374_008336 [Naegleria lovaniensis]KAG2378193.1 hypothetical protein C9374_008336 [Naegleria lovaniensis]
MSNSNQCFTTVNTACSIIPPLEVWPFIYSEHSPERVLDYDNNRAMWPAHINVTYPFVAQAGFTAAKTKLKQVFKENSISSFDIELSDFDIFEHTHTSIIFMRPRVIGDSRGDDLLKLIHDLIVTAFNIKENHEYEPHLSVAYVKTEEVLKRKKRLEEKLLQPIRFTVDKLHFLATSKENGKMYSKCEIMLDSNV